MRSSSTLLRRQPSFTAGQMMNLTRRQPDHQPLRCQPFPALPPILAYSLNFRLNSMNRWQKLSNHKSLNQFLSVVEDRPSRSKRVRRFPSPKSPRDLRDLPSSNARTKQPRQVRLRRLQSPPFLPRMRPHPSKRQQISNRKWSNRKNPNYHSRRRSPKMWTLPLR
uniref:(northern house mosquito) hypothetical protein n=1 Tax=Culex pipiens TaxID=7175 RepID=A0A8D8G7V9_CULPI